MAASAGRGCQRSDWFRSLIAMGKKLFLSLGFRPPVSSPTRWKGEEKMARMVGNLDDAAGHAVATVTYCDCQTPAA